jgi:DNA uptake protein ComE-like DNA-binding protein
MGDFQENANSPDPIAQPNRALFPSNIGLEEMFVTYSTATKLSAEIDELNRFKYGYIAGDPPPFSMNVSNPWEEWPGNNPQNRSADYKFVSQGDADWFMRGMRLDNPGLRDPKVLNNQTDDLKYKAFAWADAASLAFRGGSMIIPNSSDTSKRPSGDLEGAFYDGGLVAGQPDSAYRGAANYMPTLANRFNFFPPDKSLYWFRYSWDFSSTRTANWMNPTATPDAFGTAPALPIRPLLTTHNGVSNSINVHAEQGGNIPNDAMLPYNIKGRWSPYKGYTKNDIVIWGAPGAAHPPTLPPAYAPTSAYVCLANYTAPALPITEPLNPQQPNYAAANANWARIIPRGIHAPGTYPAGSAVTFITLATGARQVYICTNAGGTTTVPPSADWYTLPVAETPPKVSLNTAPFGELFRGFYNVMADMSPQRTPFDAAIEAAITAASGTPNTVRAGEGAGRPGTFNDPYVGNKFLAQFTAPPFDYDQTNTAANPVSHPGAMFRSPIRTIPQAAAPFFPQDKVRLPADQVLLLRAAIAAVNAEDMRDRDMDVTGRLVHLQGYFANVPTRQPIDAVVYGCEPQPFITEVFANNDDYNGANPGGYVAVEIHNPYGFPIPLAGFQIISADRNIAAPNPTPDPIQNHHIPEAVICDFSDPTTFWMNAGAPAVIPANGYIVLENFNDGTAVGVTANPYQATARPAASGLPPGGPIGPLPPNVVSAFVPGLSDNIVGPTPRTVLDREMMLMKRRNFDGGFSTGTYDFLGVTTYDDNPASPGNAFPAYVKHMVPVDSYDFTGLAIPPGVNTPGNRKAIHYSREVQPLVATSTWKFVYPGRYDGALSSAAVPRSRQAGTYEITWDPGAAPPDTDPWDYTLPPGAAPTPITLGWSYVGAAPPTPPAPGSNDNAFPTNPRQFRVQWANGNFVVAPGDMGAFVGVSRTGPGGNVFPFGGFMRNGDVLNVPFIGAYRLYDPDPAAPPNSFFEMNPVTMDAAMAEDTVQTNDQQAIAETGAYDEYREQLGRFFPPSNPTAMPAQTYDWASDILDHFTAIQNPHDDFYPNIDPARYPQPAGGYRTPGVSSSGGNAANTETDQQVPIEGLININTASATVLAELPLVVDKANGQIIIADNKALADAIVHFRDVDDGTGVPHGPFKNLFELNRVINPGAPGQGFRNMWGQQADNADSTDFLGDYTPVGFAANDGVTMDYEERYGNLIRLSNLLTTRSDVFTVYVLVQGWKNVGSKFPVLVAERRSAFIADRSRINSSNSALNVVPMSTR